MGNPDGGWYDETPPYVVGASPADKATGVNSKRVNIYFNEFIKIENASEKIVVSPPQLEQPEIKAAGKKIEIKLQDSLKANTTYTVDFSDAITDNNEGNPLGNYTYSFSTGAEIDTFEVSGIVLNAEDLEPVKGILVGLYDNTQFADPNDSLAPFDSVFAKQPMLRVSRTNGSGQFIIKGVAPGSYRCFALMDADGDYKYGQKSEQAAFSHEVIVPSCKPDIRQDTIWSDTLHIKDIERIHYTHFLPDDIVLRAFTTELTDRYFLKCERKEPDHFSLYFTYGSDSLPQVRGLNFASDSAFVVETSVRRDTVTYWIRDTTLINTDSLEVELTYLMTDSTGLLVSKTDTMMVLPKMSYERRQKLEQKEMEKWLKQQEKAKKKGLDYDSVMPPKELSLNVLSPTSMSPEAIVRFESPVPLQRVDSSMIHLYSKIDSLWYEARFLFRPDSLAPQRKYELLGEWRPGVEYSLEIDSAAFCDIYGLVNHPIKKGLRVRENDDFSSLLMTISGFKGKSVIVQLLSSSGQPQRSLQVDNGQAEFFYVTPGTYYMRMIVDENGNGRWDTGDYFADRQPEEVFYYPNQIECKARWDVNLTWNPTDRRLDRQKPGKITKQKADKQKTIKNKNMQRAQDLGIEPPAPQVQR